jgi:hypothetical protein
VIPLRVIADMMSRTVVSDDGLHLDSLLMAAVAKRDDLPPLLSQRQAIDAEPLSIPIALSECGRYYRATAALGSVEARENRYLNRRFPLHESIALGDDSFRRVQLSSSACKGFRVPVESSHVDRWTWYAVGDLEAVRELVPLVTRLGKRRAVGEGLVRAWTVEACEPWDGAFPVLDVAGMPLRNVPADMPGLSDRYVARIGRLMPPYWLRHDEHEVACLS